MCELDAGATIGSMATRENLMRAVLDLPEEGIDPTLDFIASRYQDPVLRLLDNAPDEDEEITAEEEAAVAEGRADIAAGRVLSHEDMLRKYG